MQQVYSAIKILRNIFFAKISAYVPRQHRHGHDPKLSPSSGNFEMQRQVDMSDGTISASNETDGFGHILQKLIAGLFLRQSYFRAA